MPWIDVQTRVISENDVRTSWDQASPKERSEIRELAKSLDAEVALAAATGEIDKYRRRPEYDLWRMYSEGRSTTAGFKRIIAEAKAAPLGSRCVRLRLAGYAIGIVGRMPRRLANALGRKPTFAALMRGYAEFVSRAQDALPIVRRSRSRNSE